MTIKAIREKFGLTQRELSAITGFHQVAISRWEHGHHIPTRANQKLIKEAIRLINDKPELLEKVRSDLNKNTKPKPLV